MASDTTNQNPSVRSWYQSTLDRAASNIHHTVAAAGLSTPIDEFLDANGQFVVRVDLPGLDPDDIEARICQRKLIVKAKRRQREDIPSENRLRSEVAYGTIRRSIPLASWVRNGEVDVQYENGVLELRLETDPATCPQAMVFKPRKVEAKRRNTGPSATVQHKQGSALSA